MSQNAILKDKKGKLTIYGFACGYIEQKEIKGIQTTLWLENSCWNVRQHDFNTHTRIFWECPETLSLARKRFNQAIKKLGL